MNFRTLYDLNIAITKNLSQIKNFNIDLVVGIPKSGMIPATLIATYLNLPFTDTYGYISEKYYGRDGKQTVIKDISGTHKTILLVDDSINSGKAMIRVISELSNTRDKIIKFAVFGSTKTKSKYVDYICELVDLPRMFQWNIWKHDNLSMCGTDLDGVLCRDPSKKEIKNSFNDFLDNTNTLYNLSKPIQYIITARKEQYRFKTEQWLRNNNILYHNLIMKPNDYKSGDSTNSEFKSKIINEHNDIKFYIESNDIQAQLISKKVKIPVWCTDTQRLYNEKS